MRTTSKRDTSALRANCAERFRAAVRARREFIGLTSKELAHKMGVSESWVRHIESADNSASPTLVSVVQFAQALKMKPSELIACLDD